MEESERIDIYEFIPPPLPLMEAGKDASEYFTRQEKLFSYRPHASSLPRDRNSLYRPKVKDSFSFSKPSSDSRTTHRSDRSSQEQITGLNQSLKSESKALPPLSLICLCKNSNEEFGRSRECFGGGGRSVPIVHKDNVSSLFSEDGSYSKYPLVYQRPRPDSFPHFLESLLDPNLPFYLGGESVPTTSCLIHKAKVQQRSAQRNEALTLCEFAFDSEFEGGNLDRAVRVRDNEFHLFLTCDSNTKGYTQWFYFSVRNVHKDSTLTLSLVNFAKNGSPYARGMHPCILSLTRFKRHNVSWTRGGFDVRYVKNSISKGRKGTYFTLAFSYSFQYDHDTVYFAYSEPYTYTKMTRFIGDLGRAARMNGDIKYEERTLSETVGGLRCPYLVITDGTGLTTGKKIVGISARVHPGETVGSFMVEGFLKFVTSNAEEAVSLRRHCIFYVIPMLNPDGVVLGNTRTGLAGVDLNRKWDRPSAALHPVISAAKGLLTDAVCFVDLHGHSKKDFCFMYGNTFQRKDDRFWTSRFLSIALAKLTPHFSYSLCYFFNSHSHDKAARTVMFHEKGVLHSFTLEASFNASFHGDKKTDFSPNVLREIGTKLGEAVYGLVLLLMRKSGKETTTQEGIYGLVNQLVARLQRERQKRSASSTAPAQSSTTVGEDTPLPELPPEVDPSQEVVSSGSESDPSEDDLDPEDSEMLQSAIQHNMDERRLEAASGDADTTFQNVTSSYHFKDPLEGVMLKFEAPIIPGHPYRRNMKPVILRRQLRDPTETSPRKLISTRKYTQVLNSLHRTSGSPDLPSSTPRNSGFESYLQFVRAVRQKMTKPRLPPM